MMWDDLVWAELGGRLKYFPVVEWPTSSWILGEGRLTLKMLDDYMPPASSPDSHIMICGNKDFNKLAYEGLTTLGFKDE